MKPIKECEGCSYCFRIKGSAHPAWGLYGVIYYRFCGLYEKRCAEVANCTGRKGVLK